jgi:hypothetical protein
MFAKVVDRTGSLVYYKEVGSNQRKEMETLDFSNKKCEETSYYVGKTFPLFLSCSKTQSCGCIDHTVERVRMMQWIGIVQRLSADGLMLRSMIDNTMFDQSKNIVDTMEKV